MRHAPSYHAYTRSTPVIDAIGAIVGVASVVIGTYALLFLGFAMHYGNAAVAFKNGLIITAIAATNGLFETTRHWIRHHG